MTMKFELFYNYTKDKLLGLRGLMTFSWTVLENLNFQVVISVWQCWLVKRRELWSNFKMCLEVLLRKDDCELRTLIIIIFLWLFSRFHVSIQIHFRLRTWKKGKLLLIIHEFVSSFYSWLKKEILKNFHFIK